MVNMKKEKKHEETQKTDKCFASFCKKTLTGCFTWFQSHQHWTLIFLLLGSVNLSKTKASFDVWNSPHHSCLAMFNWQGLQVILFCAQAAETFNLRYSFSISEIKAVRWKYSAGHLKKVVRGKSNLCNVWGERNKWGIMQRKDEKKGRENKEGNVNVILVCFHSS